MPRSPVFGSWAAQEDYFDRDHSDFRPSHWLTAPGTLKGQWLAPGQESLLQIRPDPSRKEDEGDVFVMQVGSVKWPFESSYGSFAVYGCDVDGDRIDEVVIEDGMGRGTCVYRRRLTILKLFDGAWQSVFSDWLSGYLPNDQGSDPLAWQRRYRFCFVRPNAFDVLLRLVPPERVPLSLDASEDYAPLQHPRCIMRYYPALKAFRIWDETFARPPVPGRQPGLGKRAMAPAMPAPFVTNGNVWVTNTAKKVVQLTSSGKDRAPTVSPDGRCIAFIRKSKNQSYLSVGGEEDYKGDEILADQIWAVDLSTGKERLLVSDRMPGKGDVTKELERTIAHIDDDSLCFSPDGSDLYFISSAWVTSGALHVVNLRAGKEHFIAAANSVEVVQSGEYAGHLIVNQHRYFLGTGSFDWYWLLDSKGREIGPVGECQDQVKTFKEIND